jgi:Tfp pilus assembly protein PilF
MTRNVNSGTDGNTGGSAALPAALQAALAQHRAGRHDEALAAYERVLALDADCIDALYNRSQILLARGRAAEALPGFERVAALLPADAGAQRACGVARQALGLQEEALASFGAALALEPAHAGALIARGGALHALGRCEEALESYARARALAPEEPLLHWNESLCRLAMGDYARGWREYEWRWKWSGFSSPALQFREPLWLGREDLAGRTIILHAEQGLGDTLQFVRYVPLVAARGARVLLMVQKLLLPLMGGLRGPERVVGPGAELPLADFHAPLLSLPLAFGTTLETVPANVPYLSVAPGRAEARRAQLAPAGERLVGLCWKGNAQYQGDRERSIALAGFLPLLSTPGIRFVALQKELNEDERALTAGLPQFSNPGEDFARTAEIVAALDLVITVDTAWGHLAGALGRPLWVLLPQSPHWCWLRERRDSPWYPTARLFRQQARGDWQGVLREVAQALASR